MHISTTGIQGGDGHSDQPGECSNAIRRANSGMTIREKLEEEFRRTFATRAKQADGLNGPDVNDRGRR